MVPSLPPCDHGCALGVVRQHPLASRVPGSGLRAQLGGVPPRGPRRLALWFCWLPCGSGSLPAHSGAVGRGRCGPHSPHRLPAGRWAGWRVSVHGRALPREAVQRVARCLCGPSSPRPGTWGRSHRRHRSLPERAFSCASPVVRWLLPSAAVSPAPCWAGVGALCSRGLSSVHPAHRSTQAASTTLLPRPLPALGGVVCSGGPAPFLLALLLLESAASVTGWLFSVLGGPRPCGWPLCPSLSEGCVSSTTQRRNPSAASQEPAGVRMHGGRPAGAGGRVWPQPWGSHPLGLLPAGPEHRWHQRLRRPQVPAAAGSGHGAGAEPGARQGAAGPGLAAALRRPGEGPVPPVRGAGPGADRSQRAGECPQAPPWALRCTEAGSGPVTLWLGSETPEKHLDL